MTGGKEEKARQATHLSQEHAEGRDQGEWKRKKDGDGVVSK